MGWRILLVPIILGGTFFVVGFREWRLAVKAKSNPQHVTASQLEASGPGNNAHIVMSDFKMCEWSFVYEARKSASKEDWKWVWVPVVPRDSAYAQQVEMLAPGMQPPPPSDVRIIIKSNQAEDENDVHVLASRDSLQGLVVNEIESLGGEEKKLLAQSYPGIDFSRCWIVQVDRKPAGSAQVLGFMGGGGMLCLAGVAWLVGAMRK